MRQAGRYLPEYRALRERHDFLTSLPHAGAGVRDHAAAGARGSASTRPSCSPTSSCRCRAWACDVDVQPRPAARAIRSAAAADVASLRVPDPRESTPYVLEAVRLIRARARRPRAADRLCRRAVHDGDVPGRGRRLEVVRRDQAAAVRRPARRRTGCSASAPTRSASLPGRAGRRRAPQAAMLFDTWAGLLAPGGLSARSRCRTSGACSTAVREAAAARIGARRAAHLLRRRRGRLARGAAPRSAPTVIGLDWRMDLDAARARARARRWRSRAISIRRPARFASLIRQRARGVLRAARGRSGAVGDATGPAVGHIFNLGSRHPAADAARSRARCSWTAVRECSEIRHERRAAAAVPPRVRRHRLRRRRSQSAPLDLLRRYDQPGPRYTSYPTAVEFHDGVRRERRTGRGWPRRRATPTTRCRSTCTCRSARSAARSAAARSSSRRSTRSRPGTSTYLHRELAMLADAPRPAAGSVVQYHWGGGTPTYLTLAEMEALHGTVAQSLRRRSPAPRSRSRSIRASRPPSSWRCCASSASTGCRSACRTSRPRCRRPSTASSPRTLTRRLFDDARRLGFESINIDLIYGLPLQTLRVVRPRRRRRRVDAARSRGRLLVRARAVDSRQPEAHRSRDAADRRAQARAVRRGDGALPGRRLRADRHGPLRAAGRRSRARLGRAAGSTATSWATRRSPRPTWWASACRRSATSPARSSQNTKKLSDLLRRSRRRAVSGRARLPARPGRPPAACAHHRVDVQLPRRPARRSSARFGIAFDDYFAAELAELAAGPMADGLIERQDGGFEVTPSGRLLVRNIAMIFDRHLRARTYADAGLLEDHLTERWSPGTVMSQMTPRGIPTGGVAPPSDIPDIFGRRALGAGRRAPRFMQPITIPGDW